MSDERFDKNIKQKLESVRPAFEESAWKKFRTAMPLPWYTTLFQDWGGWIFGGIASAAFLTTLYFNYLQQKTNELLNEEISTIKSVQNLQVKIDTVLIEKYLIDTVYVVKTVRQIVEVPARQDLANSRFIVGNTAENEPFGVSRSVEKHPVSSESLVGVGSSNSSENSITKNQKSDASSDVNTAKIPDKSIAESGESVREEPVSEKEKITTTDKPSVADLTIPETKTAEVAKKKFKFPYVRTRVGLAGDYLGLKVPSVGPTAEFFFGYSNLSLSTGLLFSSPQENSFAATRDFNRFTGKQFEELYKDMVRPQQPQRKIEDITIQTSFIKVPIAFNYYINTRSNFDFMFTAGTRLDVSVFQDIQFQSSLLSEQTNERFESRPKPKVFSGLFYGMGLQYQKGRFVGQFTPYFDFRFRQSEYLAIPRNFGIKASVKYDLGRGL
ncbi:MAG: hypothetical protein NWQ46_03900 [Spirosomaceae bacterium]|nr:hypothetical protein [Spirosomataceae bacterium]